MGSVCARQVTVQRGRVKLREAVDLADLRVDAVGNRNIDQAVVRAKRNSRLSALLGERVQAAEDTKGCG
eukprot:scaffold1402_cov403-Prasinococcus_capsulatus_cf.AAC.5